MDLDLDDRESSPISITSSHSPFISASVSPLPEQLRAPAAQVEELELNFKNLRASCEPALAWAEEFNFDALVSPPREVFASTAPRPSPAREDEFVFNPPNLPLRGNTSSFSILSVNLPSLGRMSLLLILPANLPLPGNTSSFLILSANLPPPGRMSSFLILPANLPPPGNTSSFSTLSTLPPPGRMSSFSILPANLLPPRRMSSFSILPAHLLPPGRTSLFSIIPAHLPPLERVSLLLFLDMLHLSHRSRKMILSSPLDLTSLVLQAPAPWPKGKVLIS